MWLIPLYRACASLLALARACQASAKTNLEIANTLHDALMMVSGECQILMKLRRLSQAWAFEGSAHQYNLQLGCLHIRLLRNVTQPYDMHNELRTCPMQRASGPAALVVVAGVLLAVAWLECHHQLQSCCLEDD